MHSPQRSIQYLLKVLIGLLLFGGVVYSPGVVFSIDEEGFNKLDTEHFSIYGNTRFSEMRETAQTLEDCFSLLSSSFPEMVIHVPLPIEVVLFAHLADFNELTLYLVDLSLYRSDDDLPFGFFHYYPEKSRLIITRSVFKKYIPDLFKDMARVFVQASIDQPPLWLEEGISHFMGTVERTPETYIVGRLKKDDVKLIVGGGYLPLHRFMKTGRSSSLLKTDEEALLQFQIQAAMFTNFLLYANSKQYQAHFFSYIRRLINGEESREAFLASFPAGTVSLQEAFQQLLTRYKIAYTVLERKNFKHKPFASIGAVSRAEIDSIFGDEFLRHNNQVKAQQYFSRGLANDERSIPNLLGLAAVFHIQNLKADADKKFQQACKLSPETYPALRARAFFLLRTGRKAECLQIFKNTISYLEHDLPVLKQAAHIAVELGQDEVAVSFLTLILKYQPDNMMWSNIMINTQVRLQNYSQAAVQALKFYRRDPSRSERLKQLLELLEHLPADNTKAALLLQARTKDANNSAINKALGDLYLQLENKQAALSYYQRCLNHSPADEEVKKLVNDLKTELAPLNDPEENSGQQ
ncbi:tetratricopeptide repeat protein [candidate division CSSED10-310 bacterium]|uniref:Tetratricopeptide repeat protein n=1 Tax=candidate division CSSED10-310 bacterium TaxID=2855610 RepID=A0ABV6YXR4_UNCC1